MFSTCRQETGIFFWQKKLEFLKFPGWLHFFGELQGGTSGNSVAQISYVCYQYCTYWANF